MLFIAVPAYGGVCYTDFTNSLIKLSNMLNEVKLPHTIEFLNSDSLISRARNSLVAKFYSNPDNEYLLFLDSDLIFNPNAVIKMLQSDKEVIGCCYPKKKLNWDKIKATNELGEDEKLSLITDINYNVYPGEKEVIGTSLIRAKDIPTGFMCIKREVITALMLNYPERKYKNNIAGFDDAMKNYYYDLFGTGVVDGIYLSEDYYFCHLCTEVGIKLYLETGFTFGHIGRETFYGNLALQLNHFKNDNMNADVMLLKK